MSLAELVVTLGPLLSTTDKDLLAVDLVVIELLDGLGGGLVRGEVDETKALALALVILAKSDRNGLSKLGNEVLKLLVGDSLVQVLDVDVGELSALLLDLGLTLFLANVVADVDLLVVQQHAVDVLDGGLGSSAGRVVDKGETARLAILVVADLAREDLTEGGKGVVKGLVVDRLVEVLDEDVALACLAEGWVALRPHDAARATLDERVVEVLESALAIVGVEIVDIGVPERTARDGITADTDPARQSARCHACHR